MSIKILHRVVCDFCGKTLNDESYVYMSTPNWQPPAPTMEFNFRMGGISVDLCSDCSLPIWQAKDARIKELQEAGKLTGYPQP